MEEIGAPPVSSGVLLAGGKSQRMGRDKGQLRLGGETLVARALRTLGRLSDDLVLVTNTPEPYAGLGARLVGDVIPGGGALAGIHAGLLAARHSYAMVVACDMPFLSVALLGYMQRIAAGYAAAVPRSPAGLEPLHAIYSRACIPVIEQLLHQGRVRIVELYSYVQVRYLEWDEILPLDPEGLSFFNINSPEDWARAQELAANAESV